MNFTILPTGADIQQELGHSDLDSEAAVQIGDKYKEIMKKKRG